MDFQLSDEHRQLRDMVCDFAEKELRPVAAENDRLCRFPKEQVKKLGELGLMGISVPEEYGGSGMDSLSYAIVIEEISRVCASTGVVLSVNNSLICDILKKYGNEDQKKRYLTPLAKGEKIGAYCLTEPQSGSDAGSQKTTAKRTDEGYTINGLKNWITNGPQAGVFILFCMTDPDKETKGVSAFVLDSNLPGIELGKDENKLGIRATGTCEISFDNVKLKKEHLLGDEGMGYKIALTSLDGGRVGIASQALGIAQAAYDEALAYAKEREAFGKKIAEFQGLQWMLADMITEIDAARLMVYQAAWMKDQGGRFTKYSAMAKLFAAEMSNRVCQKALQIHGGYGYTKDYDVERHLRDARITEIYEGTSEIQRIVIASQVFKEKAI